MKHVCFVCGSKFEPIYNKIMDYEYGVQRNSVLLICTQCGLVAQSPPVSNEDLEDLYPVNYAAHRVDINARGLYNFLKKKLFSRHARRIASLIPLNGSVLEIGCGNGQLLSEIKKNRPDIQLVGVDIFKPYSSSSDFIFHLGQIEDVQLSENSFDLIYNSNLIEHVVSPVNFLRRSYSLLKQGGILYGVTPNHSSLDRFLFTNFWGGYHYPRHTYIFNHRNIVQLLRSAGFVDFSVKGGYSFWSVSFFNVFIKSHAEKQRGIGFFLIALAFLPVDFFLGLFYPHGSMTFISRKPS